MESGDLTIEQAESLRRRAAEMLRYTVTLRQRMERLAFPHEDPLYRATVDAFYALQHLHIQAHYLTCSSGVGRQNSGRQP
jgi:aromatic ring-cleaving dioxygenase